MWPIAAVTEAVYIDLYNIFIFILKKSTKITYVLNSKNHVTQTKKFGVIIKKV